MKPDHVYLRNFEKGKEFEQKVSDLFDTFHPLAEKPSRTLRMEGAAWRHLYEQADARALVAVECKRRGDIDWTGPKDFPYPTVIVNEERKMRSPYVDKAFYYSLPVEERKLWIKFFNSVWCSNPSMSQVIVIIPASKPYWQIERKFDRLEREYVTNWVCPVEKCLFRPWDRALELLRWL